MMKSIVALALVLSASASFADSIRPVSTNNLSCSGQSKEGEAVHLEITSSRAGAHIIVDGFSDYNLNQIQVGSEGNVYIQVVNRNFNLFLAGDALDQVLNGKIGTTAVDLNGRIQFFRGQTFDLNCKGDLTSENFGNSIAF